MATMALPEIFHFYECGDNALVLDDDVIPQAIAPPLSATPLKWHCQRQRERFLHNNEELIGTHCLTPTPH